ncbi:MAG: glutamate racemase [Oscillospiraceae bacterium]|nr:glutamate racemase [Oscillospiraceae bacterium]
MDNRPIGVFDSGLGGLTTVRRLMQTLPGEDIIYLGDTGRVPYGSRSKETITRYAIQDAAFLRQFDIKTLVIACGTVSTTAIDTLREKNRDFPIYGVVEATVADAAAATGNKKIGAIGTQATINSMAYKTGLEALIKDVQYRGKACPLFVPLVENGRTEPGDIVVETVVAEYLEEFKAWGADTLILGCTHYPLLERVIGQYMGSGVKLIDSGASTAEYVASQLRDMDMLGDAHRSPEYRYYVTDSTEGFKSLASMFLKTDHLGTVSQVSLEGF